MAGQDDLMGSTLRHGWQPRGSRMRGGVRRENGDDPAD